MNDPHSELEVVGRVAEAFLARYRRGERPSLMEYTDQYPELAEQIRDLFPAMVVMEELGSVKGHRRATPMQLPRQGKVHEQMCEYRHVYEDGRRSSAVVLERVTDSFT